MENLITRVKDHFEVSQEKAEETVKALFTDYKALQDRLDKYSAYYSYEQVVDELDGFNVEEDTFDIEYNDLQLVIEYKDGVFSIGVPVMIYISNDNGIEPLEIDLECMKEGV